MSLIWTYFTLRQDDPKHAVCNACKSKVSCGGSTPKTFGTTNLIRHLEKKHPGVFSKYKGDTAAKRRDAAELQQPQQPSTVAPMFDINTEKSNATTRKIMEFMALDDQQFCVVQDKGFVNLMKHLSPRYKLPTGGTFLTQHCHSCLRAFQAIYTNCWTPLHPRSVSQRTFGLLTWA